MVGFWSWDFYAAHSLAPLCKFQASREKNPLNSREALANKFAI